MTEQNHDAVAFLQEQHRQAQSLLSELASGAGNRREDFETLVRLLAVHETAEEMVVYPVVRANVPDGNALVDARLAEESDAKQRLSDLEKLGVDDPGFDAALTEFATAVNNHAEHEEQQVFPALREHVDSEMLERMQAALAVAQSIAPTHPHPRGPDSAVGNVIVGPFVAVVDRVRDALSATLR